MDNHQKPNDDATRVEGAFGQDNNSGKEKLDSFLSNNPQDEITTDPKTGGKISRRVAGLVGGGVLLTGGVAWAASGDKAETDSIAVDMDNDGIEDLLIEDTDQDGLYTAAEEQPQEQDQQYDTASAPGGGDGGNTRTWNPYTAPMASEGTVNDDMSFDEAFASAREELGAGGVFHWNGQWYGTFYATEVDANHQPTIDYPTVAQHDLPAAPFGDEVQNVADNPQTPSEPEAAEPEQHDDTQDTPIQNVSNPEVNQIGLDGDSDGQVDEIYVDVNLDNEADLVFADINVDGQISEDEVIVINDPDSLDYSNPQAFEGELYVDTDGDDLQDAIVADMDDDSIADVVAVDDNHNQAIEEDEIVVLNPDASTESPESHDSTSGVVYEGEVADDMPEDVPDSMLDDHMDDLANLDDGFDDYENYV